MTDQTFIMKVLKDKVVPQNTSYYTTSQNRDSVVTDYIFDFHVAKKKKTTEKRLKLWYFLSIDLSLTFLNTAALDKISQDSFRHMMNFANIELS